MRIQVILVAVLFSALLACSRTTESGTGDRHEPQVPISRDDAINIVWKTYGLSVSKASARMEKDWGTPRMDVWHFEVSNLSPSPCLPFISGFDVLVSCEDGSWITLMSRMNSDVVRNALSEAGSDCEAIGTNQAKHPAECYTEFQNNVVGQQIAALVNSVHAGPDLFYAKSLEVVKRPRDDGGSIWRMKSVGICNGERNIRVRNYSHPTYIPPNPKTAAMMWQFTEWGQLEDLSAYGPG